MDFKPINELRCNFDLLKVEGNLQACPINHVRLEVGALTSPHDLSVLMALRFMG
jgi:hypothetical protein